MKSGILNAVEAKKTFAARIRIVATTILTVLCVVLPLFALPAAETEAAKYSLPKNREVDAPSREDICGVYSIKLSNKQQGRTLQGTMTIRPESGTEYYTITVSGEVASEFRNIKMGYNPKTGMSATEYLDKDNKQRGCGQQFRGSGNSIRMEGGLVGANKLIYIFTGNKISGLKPESGAAATKLKSEKSAPQKDSNAANSQPKNGTGKQDEPINGDDTSSKKEDYEDHDDLPASDIGKVGAAVGTALAGGLLGAASAVAGTIGGAGGGAAGGAAGSVSGDYGGYDSYDDDRPAVPDNISVAEDGSIRITTPTGETLVYTPNADGSFNVPTHTETGEALTWQDEDGNWHEAEPGTISGEDVLRGAQWYKDNEQAIIADRAEEDARQEAERERLAAENAAWLEEQRAINDQKSWLSKELEKELSQMGLSEDNREYIEKMREKYAHGDKSLSKDDIKKLIKKDIEFLDNVQVEMATARQFLFTARIKASKDKQVFDTANRVEKIISEQGFEVRRMRKADIKRFLALYFEASMNGEQMPDIDGEQFYEVDEDEEDED